MEEGGVASTGLLGWSQTNDEVVITTLAHISHLWSPVQSTPGVTLAVDSVIYTIIVSPTRGNQPHHKGVTAMTNGVSTRGSGDSQLSSVLTIIKLFYIILSIQIIYKKVKVFQTNHSQQLISIFIFGIGGFSFFYVY